ncbi:zinc-binding dehydrogenase [Streptomyces sp. NPDC057580]|uniref:zinc-binding dehydrogenase n=1 Tax=Streptomyces sp. NPDC057580 TaxID=3346173 RepID=UPI0036A70866
MTQGLVSRQPGQLEIEPLQLARPGPHEVLVRTAAAGVCHSDVHFLDGVYPVDRPVVLGHEACGIVDSVGEDVVDFRSGDLVVTCLALFCGNCTYCVGGHPYLCAGRDKLRRACSDVPRLRTSNDDIVHQFVDVSAWAEMMLVSERALVKVADHVPPHIAAVFGCAVVTGLGAVFNTAKVRAGQSVVVIGCGGVGINAIQGALISGASRVIAVDVNDTKLSTALTLGATDVVDASNGDAVEQVLELTNGGVDHAIEAVGRPQTCREAVQMLRAGGSATVVGLVPPTDIIEIPSIDLLRGKRIQGSVMGSTRFRNDIPAYISLWESGRLRVDEFIDGRSRLDQIGEAIASLRDGRALRTVVTF